MPVTPAQRRVLKRGYMILYCQPPGHAFGGRYETWAAMIDRGWLKHEKSNLGAPNPWERYRVTATGKKALAEAGIEVMEVEG